MPCPCSSYSPLAHPTADFDCLSFRHIQPSHKHQGPGACTDSRTIWYLRKTWPNSWWQLLQDCEGEWGASLFHIPDSLHVVSDLVRTQQTLSACWSISLMNGSPVLLAFTQLCAISSMDHDGLFKGGTPLPHNLNVPQQPQPCLMDPGSSHKDECNSMSNLPTQKEGSLHLSVIPTWVRVWHYPLSRDAWSSCLKTIVWCVLGWYGSCLACMM